MGRLLPLHPRSVHVHKVSSCNRRVNVNRIKAPENKRSIPRKIATIFLLRIVLDTELCRLKSSNFIFKSAGIIFKTHAPSAFSREICEPRIDGRFCRRREFFPGKTAPDLVISCVREKKNCDVTLENFRDRWNLANRERRLFLRESRLRLNPRGNNNGNARCDETRQAETTFKSNPTGLDK